MFNIDARMMKQMAPLMQRVLIVDSATASARLLTDLLRDIAPCQVWHATDIFRGIDLAGAYNPHLIFVEQDEAVDGLDFTRRLRRGKHSCRKAPVIMCTSTATAAAIVKARDVGAHEFLRKPYTIRDLVRRIEAVTLRKRDWVEAVNYIGPDRRRFNSGDYSGPLKRQQDAETPSTMRVIQALKILRSAVAAVERDPEQAMRAMLAQAAELQAAAQALKDDALAEAATSLQAALAAADARTMKKSDLNSHLAALLAFMPADNEKSAAA